MDIGCKDNTDINEDPTVTPDERMRGVAFSKLLSMRVLTRMWQMLIKSLDEITVAPSPIMAAEMIIIRLTHAADLPPTEDLIKKIENKLQGASNGKNLETSSKNLGAEVNSHGISQPKQNNASNLKVAPAVDEGIGILNYIKFENILELVKQNRDVKLLVDIENSLRLVTYRPGYIEFTPTEFAPANLAQRLSNDSKNGQEAAGL